MEKIAEFKENLSVKLENDELELISDSLLQLMNNNNKLNYLEEKVIELEKQHNETKQNIAFCRKQTFASTCLILKNYATKEVIDQIINLNDINLLDLNIFDKKLNINKKQNIPNQ